MGVLILPLLLSNPAASAGLRITTSNDFLSGTNQSDDLYTAALDVSFALGSGQVQLGERIFTDRERGLRLDETFAQYQHPLQTGRLEGEFSFGVVHVGHGAGRAVQNSLHSAIGSPKVDLPYSDRDDWYPTAELQIARSVTAGRLGALSATTDLFVAPGFRSWVEVGMAVAKSVGPVQVKAEVGLAAHEVEIEELQPRIAETSPTWKLGASINRLALEWSYNRYGTESKHVSLSYLLRLGDHRGWNAGRN